MPNGDQYTTIEKTERDDRDLRVKIIMADSQLVTEIAKLHDSATVVNHLMNEIEQVEDKLRTKGPDDSDNHKNNQSAINAE
jgi:hypothetical protein